MCCFFTALVFFGPRLGFLVYWILAPLYVVIFPMVGFDWIFVGLGIFADIISYTGAYRERKQVPYYSGP